MTDDDIRDQLGETIRSAFERRAPVGTDLNLVRSDLARRGRKPRSGRRVAVGVVAVAAAIGSAGYVAGTPESGSQAKVKVVAPDRTTTTTNVAILREADFVNAFHADLDCLRKHGFGATRDSYIAFYRGGGVQVSIGSSFGAPQANGAVVTTTPSAALATTSTAPHRVESAATRPSLPVSGSTPITRAHPGTLAGIEQECAALLRLLMIRFPGAGQPAVSRTPEFVACVARRSSGHGVDATAIAMRCQAQVTDKLFLIKRVH